MAKTTEVLTVVGCIAPIYPKEGTEWNVTLVKCQNDSPKLTPSLWGRWISCEVCQKLFPLSLLERGALDGLSRPRKREKDHLAPLLIQRERGNAEKLLM
jgi:hypothetical protein